MIRFLVKLSLWIIVIAIIAAGIYFAPQLFPKPESHKNIIGTVKKADLEQRITFAGVITSKKRTIITAPYSGYIKELFVKIGDHVKKGDPVLSIAASLDSFEPVHPLRAPFAGVVSLIRKSQGEFVKENDAQDYVLRIDDLSKFFVEAKIPEIDRMKVAVGQEAIIKASAISNIPFHGVVQKVSLAPEEKNQGFSFGGKSQVEYPVLIAIKDNDDRLKPGLSAIVDVIAASKKQVLTLGHEFVHDENGQSFVILENGSKQEVKIGLKNDEAVEIIEGLQEGEHVQQIEFAP